MCMCVIFMYLLWNLFWYKLQWIQNSKIKKLSDHIHVLEEKLQHAYNENAKLKVKHEKLWRGLESKFSSTKAICDQLTETLQTLADQVHNGKRLIVDPWFLNNEITMDVTIMVLLVQLRKTKSCLKVSCLKLQ